MIKLVVGLGNPGARYKDTRHNIGFQIVDRCLEEKGLNVEKENFSLGELFFIRELDNKQKIFFLKPFTYMNASGIAVSKIAFFYKILPSEILVIHDELDLPLGRLKFKAGGGTAGHNGIKSICRELGNRDFLRLRVGIGRPLYGEDIASFVLSPFYKEQQKKWQDVIKIAKEAVFCCLKEGFIKAQEKFNRKNI
ncbi:peptidyl-tRNA hydrolase, PTH1 family [Desulfonauticus submarinus]|uniref:Peptidyl-tRNA hydrolase n=1 Tax=Desulfonauticus submarinus TaxID=206665 RepID=A0A1G9ZRS1_9BACT|nr:aminoacyl-tRNA hydrolase [Desulfonauticus submarinus]SDN23797.1 peptidyl-tRNA hydrolase, PTH1 family [Desulfonauticus submarinus]